jgi:hypothetical protein
MTLIIGEASFIRYHRAGRSEEVTRVSSSALQQ